MINYTVIFRLMRPAGQPELLLNCMIKIIPLVLTCTFASAAAAVEIQCPAKIGPDMNNSAPSGGWVKYKRKATLPVVKGQSSGALAGAAVHDGSPDAVLGDLIPDNDDTGMQQGYWLWNVEGIGAIYAGCDYAGTDVTLIKKIEGKQLKSCRVFLNGRKRYAFSCK